MFVWMARCPPMFDVAVSFRVCCGGVVSCLLWLCRRYERTHPVINGTVEQLPTGSPNVYTSPKAPLHVVVGTAGAMQDDSFVSPVPAWSAVRAADTFRYPRLSDSCCRALPGRASDARRCLIMHTV